MDFALKISPKKSVSSPTLKKWKKAGALVICLAHIIFSGPLLYLINQNQKAFIILAHAYVPSLIINAEYELMTFCVLILASCISVTVAFLHFINRFETHLAKVHGEVTKAVTSNKSLSPVDCWNLHKDFPTLYESISVQKRKSEQQLREQIQTLLNLKSTLESSNQITNVQNLINQTKTQLGERHEIPQVIIDLDEMNYAQPVVTETALRAS